MTLDPDVRRHLDGTPVAHLATVLPDGSPHTVPLWVGTHGDHVVFLTSPHSRKARSAAVATIRLLAASVNGTRERRQIVLPEAETSSPSLLLSRTVPSRAVAR